MNKWPPADSGSWLCSYSVGVFFSAGGRVIKRTMSLQWYLQHQSSLPILLVVLNIMHSSRDNLVGSHYIVQGGGAIYYRLSQNA